MIGVTGEKVSRAHAMYSKVLHLVCTKITPWAPFRAGKVSRGDTRYGTQPWRTFFLHFSLCYASACSFYMYVYTTLDIDSEFAFIKAVFSQSGSCTLSPQLRPMETSHLCRMILAVVYLLIVLCLRIGTAASTVFGHAAVAAAACVMNQRDRPSEPHYRHHIDTVTPNVTNSLTTVRGRPEWVGPANAISLANSRLPLYWDQDLVDVLVLVCLLQPCLEEKS